MCFPPVLSHRKDAESAEFQFFLLSALLNSVPKVLRFASSYDQEVRWAMFLAQRKKVCRN
jgi:hypothetical protein